MQVYNCMGEFVLKKKRKLKKEAKIVIFGAISLVLIALVVLIVSHVNKFDFLEALNSNIITIDDTNICLRELSYYIIKVENSGQERAELYNKDNPSAYWNMYMNDTTESGYVSDIAKKAAVNYCIRDNIYYKRAVLEEYSLTPDEESDLKYDAQNMYETMTHAQRTMTQLTQADYEIILLKERLAYKYMSDLTLQDCDDLLKAYVLKYDIGGEYYESLKNEYNIWIDEELLEHIRVGFITVNN